MAQRQARQSPAGSYFESFLFPSSAHWLAPARITSQSILSTHCHTALSETLGTTDCCDCVTRHSEYSAHNSRFTVLLYFFLKKNYSFFCFFSAGHHTAICSEATQHIKISLCHSASISCPPSVCISVLASVCPRLSPTSTLHHCPSPLSPPIPRSIVLF